MLYWFYELFDINLFSYITFRAGVGFFISFIVTLYFIPKFITWAKQRNATQPIYTYAPDGHQEKQNTPTMGGMVFVGATLLATLFSANLENSYIQIGILLLLLISGIGVMDDVGKVFKQKNAAGLSSRSKFLMQMSVGLLISSLLYWQSNLLTSLYLPFMKSPLCEMGFWSIPFWAIVITAASNAVNLTDGLDGLAAVPSIFAFFSLGILLYITGHAILSASLLMPKIIGVGEVVILAFSFMGGLVAFLWFNAHPAEIFMGDSGSLAIGGMIGYMGILSKSEFLLFIIGFIFVIETLSVILQVASFKIRNRRIFLMAPLHHHFELKEWAENKIIVRFWIVALISNLIALITIKIR
jgi:phospho-N-acetylmuramoyl-pentapeptide-transferase